MTDYERKKIEIELRSFTSKNFERPTDCKNLEQIRFYVRELCLKIELLEDQHQYVPESAYTLLAQYNARQNSFLNIDFRNAYH